MPTAADPLLVGVDMAKPGSDRSVYGIIERMSDGENRLLFISQGVNVTRTDVELELAEEYRKACTELAGLRSWNRDGDINIESIAVSWLYGSGTVGYDEMRGALAKLILPKLPELMAQAIAKAEKRVESARIQLQLVLNEPR